MRRSLSASSVVHFFTCDVNLLPFDLGVDFWDFFSFCVCVCVSPVVSSWIPNDSESEEQESRNYDAHVSAKRKR